MEKKLKFRYYSIPKYEAILSTARWPGGHLPHHSEKARILAKEGLKLDFEWLLKFHKQFYLSHRKKLNILPITFWFYFKDILFFHTIFYNLNRNVNRFPHFLKRFNTSKLRNSRLDDKCMISKIFPNIPQNITSNLHKPKTLSIEGSFFYGSYL